MPIMKLRKLLEDCGLRYSTIIKSRTGGYEFVSRNELNCAFRQLMNCNIKDRQLKQKIGFISKLLNGDVVFEKIRELNIFENSEKMLYDFSVPAKENYVANGFIVHNSTFRVYLRRGKQGTRVAKMIDAPNLPENEVAFFLTQHGVRDEVVG